jgi:hypothetical protein
VDGPSGGDDLSFNVEAVMRAHGDVLAQHGCEATAVGLKQPARLSFEKWEAIGRELNKRVRQRPWHFADWWAFGEHRYGERTALVTAADWEGPAFKTLANASVVARAFETSRRREVLSFRHHAEVAHLPPRQADALLDWAETPTETGKTRSVWELQVEVRRRLEQSASRTVRAVTPAAPAKPTLVVISPASEPETRDYALIPMPGGPRREDEVRQLLGESEPSSAEVQRRILGRAIAGLRYAEAELGGATPETLLAVGCHLRQLLARVMERARQSGGDWDDNVVNLG